MQHLRLRIAHAVMLLPTGGIAFVKHAMIMIMMSHAMYCKSVIST